MIAPTNSLSINPAYSQDWLKGLTSESIADLDFQQILNKSAAKKESDATSAAATETAAGDSRAGLVSLLNSLTGSIDPASVNEEQLFAGIVYDRIAAAKGEAVANEYNTLLDAKMAEHTRADGFVFVEDAARAALQEMEGSGKLTTAEAETIHAQAFQAAQLDDNTAALYDSRGDTMAVAPTATAMEKVLAMLLKFDSGEMTPERMPLAYQQGQAVAGAATSGSTAASTTATAAGSASGDTAGYTHSAEYTSYGVRNGGRQAWRIPDSGPEFGKQLKVVFADGHTVTVKDTSHNYRESDGFVFKPGIGPNGEGSANTGTAHNGVYLHAPYGNKSQTVKFYWS